MSQDRVVGFDLEKNATDDNIKALEQAIKA
jgi:hypothetical protein